jgi:hypothetical protein
VFGVAPDVTLDHMAFIACAAPAGDGGAVYLDDNATLTVRNSTFTLNRARTGGAIAFVRNGSLLMQDCTLSTNNTTAFDSENCSGGAIYFNGAASATPPAGFTPGALVVRNSTISGNFAARAGGGIGVSNFTGTLLVQNSTLSGNTASTLGGGVAATGGSGTVSIQDSTVTANAVTTTGTNSGGGGVGRTSGVANTLNVTNSVVSGNKQSAAPDIRADASTTTHVNSSAVGSAAGFTLSAASSGNLPFGAELLLGPLGNFGGPTTTYAPQNGSPLIDAGSNALVPPELTSDQRGIGVARIVDGVVDIGSYEHPDPPKVTALFVRGAAWSLAFRQFVQGSGQGESNAGFSIPGGALQRKTLPWTNLDVISIRFSQDVRVAKEDLVVSGTGVANYVVSAFNYLPANHTATWTLGQPLRNGYAVLDLDADLGGVGAAGGPLDGEWDNSRVFPSGNGTLGGDFRMALPVVPGDVDRSGSVLANDYSAVKQKFFSSASNPGGGAAGYTIFHDVDGSGSILADDFSAVKSRFFNSLPAGPPPAASATEAVLSRDEPRPGDRLG